MAPRRDEAHKREPRALLGVAPVEPCRIDVPLQVVHAREGELIGHRQPLRGIDPDQEASGQSRTVGDGDRVQLVQLGAGLLKRPVDHGNDRQEVLPRGDLGDDAAVDRVDLCLRRYDVGEDDAAVLDDGGPRLVAACLDPEYLHNAILSPAPESGLNAAPPACILSCGVRVGD